MPAPRRTPVASGAAIGVLVLAVAGTAALFRLPDPERATASSGDGVVTVAGVWAPGSAPFLVAEPEEGPYTAVRGSVYRVSAPPAPLGRPYTLSFQIPSGVSPKDAVLYGYDALVGAWRAVPAALDAAGWSLETDRLALPGEDWAVGIAYAPAPSAQAFAALRSLAAVPPPGAVGYRAAFLSAGVPDDYVVVQDPFGSGGCAGRFRPGREQTRTSVDATASERVVVVWELDTGCAPSETVSPAVRDPS